jgi:anti-anti-sigma regulatory factor
LTESRSWEVTFIQVDDTADCSVAGSLREQLSPALADTGDVVLDVRAARLDSLGLSALLAVQRQLQLNDRRLLVVADDPGFLSLVERAGVAHTLAIFRDPEQAVSCVYERRAPALAV